MQSWEKNMRWWQFNESKILSSITFAFLISKYLVACFQLHLVVEFKQDFCLGFYSRRHFCSIITCYLCVFCSVCSFCLRNLRSINLVNFASASMNWRYELYKYKTQSRQSRLWRMEEMMNSECASNFLSMDRAVKWQF